MRSAGKRDSAQTRKTSNVGKSITCARDADGTRPDRKTNIKDTRRQPTLCMQNLEVRDRRLRRHRFSRFAKPRGNNSATEASAIAKRRSRRRTAMRTGHVGGKWLCVEACWRSKRIVRDTEWIYRSLMQSRFSLSLSPPPLSFPRFNFAYRTRVWEGASCAKMHSSNVKIGTCSDVAVFRGEETRKCNLPVRESADCRDHARFDSNPGIA